VAKGWLGGLAAAVAELAFGSVCAGCEGSPGLLCQDCRDRLRQPAALVPVDVGAILRQSTASDAVDFRKIPVAAVAEYAGPARGIVLGHKERARLALARPLGEALATSVVAMLESGAGCPMCGSRAIAIVPVPSARRAVRRRGHDPLARASRRAAVLLRRVGYDCAVVPTLRHRRAVADQAGLDAAARRANLASALDVRPVGLGLLAGRCVVLVDDVVTTGATLSEASRALAAAGIQPCGAGVIAATPPRRPSLGVRATSRSTTG
jgi:predicted amidophosphoribosyltransferase